jgi:hypothetical protein
MPGRKRIGHAQYQFLVLRMRHPDGEAEQGGTEESGKARCRHNGGPLDDHLFGKM